MAEPVYTTADALRTELNVDNTVLTDAAATRLIRTAETLIDQALGARWVDDTTGRKVVQADVDSWRWDKISDATTYLAARLYSTPDALGPRYTSVRGPDFAFSGPLGSSILTPEIDALLNASGLRRAGGRARGGPAYRTWRGTLQDDGTWGDESAWDSGDASAFG